MKKKPKRFTEIEIVFLEKMAGMGYLKSDVAAFFELSEAYLEVMLENQPEALEALQRGSLNATYMAKQTLIEHAKRGDVEAGRTYILFGGHCSDLQS